MTTQISDNESLYGDAVSQYYDLLYPPADIPDMMRFMATLGPPSRLLDLGVGTGRTALPMSLAGFDVVGIDISERMLDEVREKDIDNRITLMKGDFTEVSGNADHDLVVCLNNTLPMVLDVERRESTFRNAAANLRPGGHFVLETASPFPYLKGESTRHQFTPLGRGDKVLLDIVRVEAHAMRLSLVRTMVLPGGVMTFAEQNHLLTPIEMDILAANAGLELVSRHSGWAGDDVTDASVMLVSVYRAPVGHD